MKTGIELITAERMRQVAEEGWTPEHDDIHHGDGALARAAAAYALRAIGLDPATVRVVVRRGVTAPVWPWGAGSCKSTTLRRDLEKAGALIAAALDRELRIEAGLSAYPHGNVPRENEGLS